MFLPSRLRLWIVASTIGVVSLATGAQSFVPLSNITADQVAAGGRTIWARSTDTSAPSHDTLLFNIQTFKFDVRHPDAEPYPPKFLGTGGGNIYQADETWAHFPVFGTYRFDSGTQQWLVTPYGPDQRVQNILVGTGYSDNCHPYEVWREMKDLQNNSLYLARYDFCTNQFLSVPSANTLNRVAVGGGEVWALDTSNHVHRFDGETRQFTLMPGVLTQIAVGVDDVWGINGDGQAFEFNTNTQSWDQIPSPRLEAIWAGADGVFAAKCGQPENLPSASLSRVVGGAVGGLPCWRQTVRYEPVARRFVDITSGYQADIVSVGSGAGAVAVQAAMRRVLYWFN